MALLIAGRDANICKRESWKRRWQISHTKKTLGKEIISYRANVTDAPRRFWDVQIKLNWWLSLFIRRDLLSTLILGLYNWTPHGIATEAQGRGTDQVWSAPFFLCLQSDKSLSPVSSQRAILICIIIKIYTMR